MKTYHAIREIQQADGRTLAILWNDGRRSTYDVVELRRKCPCAGCRDEWTGEVIRSPIPETVRPVTIDPVGRYAIGIRFDDGHSTGIYTYDYLRSLG